MTQPYSTPARSPIGTLALIVCLLLFAAVIVAVARHNETPGAANPAPLVPDFSIPTSQVRPPLPERIVSFHRGRADKNLIKLAAQLGFNGVQFQIEGSNEQGIADFAARDAREHLVDYCHSLGMKVTLWVHELSDLPGPWMPEYLGDETADNDRLFSFLEDRYEWILGTAVPNVDGLALTVVETQIRATQAPILLRLCDMIGKKCKEHGKSFMLRTFVWHPDELEGVMGAVAKLPHDTMLMAKCVAQDWQMRGVNAPEVAAIAQQKRPFLMEFDVEGEYFLHNSVANCMPEILKRQFDYAVSKGAQGVCVRVDRMDDNVLFQPSEMNLWTLGLLASGASSNLDDIWNRWATYRYGAKAAPGIIRTLKPTADVVTEITSIGPFTFGDTRRYPPLPDEEVFTQNWQNWQWDNSYLPAYKQATTGDPQFIANVTQQKAAAMKLAGQCLADLETVRPLLKDAEYAILRTKLLTAKTQLAYRTPMILAILEYRAAINAATDDDRQAHLDAAKKLVQEVRDVVSTQYPLPLTINYLGRPWQIGAPTDINRNVLLYWTYSTDRLLNGDREPLPKPIEHKPDPLHP